MKRVKRYIPNLVKEFIDRRLHVFVKWKKDLSSEIWNLDKEGLIIVCDTILRIAGSREITTKNFVEIGTSSFHNILHNNYSIYLDYLIEEKIVISDNFYIPGEKSISYKINEDYVDDIVSIDMSNEKYINKTIKLINSTDTKLRVSKKHKDNFKKDFKIDFIEAWNYLTRTSVNNIPDKKGRILNKYTKAILQRKLLEINDNQLFISRSATNGRITTNLSILNSDYKQFISGYKWSLDVVASQPSMLNIFIDLIMEIQGSKLTNSISYSCSYLSYEYQIIINNLGKIDGTRFIENLKNLKLPLKNELNLWRNLCENGDIYEFFSSEVFRITGEKISRSEAKQIFIIVLYSPSKSTSEYKKLFSGIFPSIYKFLNNIKSLSGGKRSHRMLPILLQATESFIWIESILPKLDDSNIKYHFIHDSVIIKEGDLEMVEGIIKEQFYISGFRAQVSIENIKK